VGMAVMDQDMAFLQRPEGRAAQIIAERFEHVVREERMQIMNEKSICSPYGRHTVLLVFTIG
jgi:hypothetical protein